MQAGQAKTTVLFLHRGFEHFFLKYYHRKKKQKKGGRENKKALKTVMKPVRAQGLNCLTLDPWRLPKVRHILKPFA